MPTKSSRRSSSYSPGIVGPQGPFVRQESLLDADNVDDRELEPFGRMQRHQRHHVRPPRRRCRRRPRGPSFPRILRASVVLGTRIVLRGRVHQFLDVGQCVPNPAAMSPSFRDAQISAERSRMRSSNVRTDSRRASLNSAIWAAKSLRAETARRGSCGHSAARAVASSSVSRFAIGPGDEPCEALFTDAPHGHVDDAQERRADPADWRPAAGRPARP